MKHKTRQLMLFQLYSEAHIYSFLSTTCNKIRSPVNTVILQDNISLKKLLSVVQCQEVFVDEQLMMTRPF